MTAGPSARPVFSWAHELLSSVPTGPTPPARGVARPSVRLSLSVPCFERGDRRARGLVSPAVFKERRAERADGDPRAAVRQQDDPGGAAGGELLLRDHEPNASTRPPSSRPARTPSSQEA